ncbi:MAG: hypothetical protein ABI374_12285 [Ginsengibacter sp.]
MKRKIPISLIIAGVLFFIFKDLFFKNDQANHNSIFLSTSETPATINKNPIQTIDTNQILNNLCERPISNNVSTSAELEIINFVPCSWEQNFEAEKKVDVVSAYAVADNNGKGVIGMALKMTELPYVVSPQQRKDFFSIQNIKKVAEEANAISARKGLLSGLDCHEIIFKKDNHAEAPEGTAYSIHFETIFKTKYIMLAYTVGYMDSVESRKIFYQYLPIFKALSQKFKIRDK